MANKGWILVLAVLMLIGLTSASADIIILKSGEIFEVQDIREENNFVYYRQGSQTGKIPADQVERLVRQSLPAEGKKQDSKFSPIPEEAGFIDLKWGQSPSHLPGLVRVSTDSEYGGVDQYVRKIPDPHFGRARVDNIFYGFWEDGLYTILVEVRNYLDFLDLKTEAFRRYGPGEQERAGIDRYRWRGGTSDRFLTYDDAKKIGYLWMRSTALHTRIRTLYPDS